MTGGASGYVPPAAARHMLEHPVPPPSGHYRWVYLWHWPIRAMHWAAAASLFLLIVTGFTIGRPYFLPQGEVSGQFFIGWMRLVHFVSAGVLVATAIVRVYWLIAGNQYERLPALFPIRRRDWVNMYRQVKFYLLIHPERAPRYLGHNPLQQVSYTLVYVVGLIMATTGFAMYGQANPAGMIRALTRWVPELLGGMQPVRLVHHVTSWFFLIFVPIHVYLAIRADFLERSGTLSSIITGGRFVPADRDFIDG
jgi:Ni/Fe-hydrogenase b-type cytochrome subunit